MTKGINIRTEWFIVEGMFSYAYKKGYSIDKLAEVLLTSEYGYEVLSEKRHSEYADSLFMLSGFKREFDLGKRKNDKYDYGDLLPGCCGHFYKYWFDKGFTDTKEIYRLAKPEIIYLNFNTLHISGYNYWVEYLKDLNGVIIDRKVGI